MTQTRFWLFLTKSARVSARVSYIGNFHYITTARLGRQYQEAPTVAAYYLTRPIAIDRMVCDIAVENMFNYRICALTRTTT